MSLSDRILDIVAQATPQAPMRDSDIYAAVCKKGRVETGEMASALETMTAQRLLSTARITRGGVTQDVYWPTGLTKPAIAGIKPKEPLKVPNLTDTDTKAQRLIKAIVAHGPITNADLADKTGTKANNVDGLLKAAVNRSQITTRQIFVPEQGRELRHWMTSTQAAEWDARAEIDEQIEIPPATDTPVGHVMSHPAAEQKSEDFFLLGVLADIRAAIGDTGQIMLGDLAQAIKTRIHDYKNDIAARDLILNNLAGTLKVQNIADIPAALDDLTHALSTRAMTTRAPAGKPALLLIDSADLTEVEMLGDDDDAQAMAMSSIELGHAARVMVVRIVGEATRRVEWKEAA